MAYLVISETTISVPRDKENVLDFLGNVVSVLQEETLYNPGDVIDSDNVSQYVKNRLDSGDDHWNSLLKETSKDAGPAPLTEPIEDYDSLSVEDILVKLKSLGTEEVNAVKAYESENEDRKEVLSFSIGAKEAPHERAEGTVQPDPSKSVKEAAEATPSKRGRKPAPKTVEAKENGPDSTKVDADADKSKSEEK